MSYAIYSINEKHYCNDLKQSFILVKNTLISDNYNSLFWKIACSVVDKIA